jgi:hypothetical protein
MSGAAIVRALLAASPAVTSIVTNPRNIVAGALEQGTVLPAISVRTISSNEERTVARLLPVKMMHERVQVTVYTKDNPKMMHMLIKACSLGPGTHAGNVVGFAVKNVLPWEIGPEIPVGDDRVYEQSRDFMVTFVEAN